MVTQFYTFHNLIGEQDAFFQEYTIEEVVVCPDTKNLNLKPKAQRICRFCGLTNPYTTFKNDAHVIPELLGNKYLISDSECDGCNAKFSRYEGDLASFLGAYRTIHGVKKKKNRFPVFLTPDNLLVVKRTPLYGIKDGVHISLDDQARNLLRVDDNAGTLEVTYKKRPYIPLNVYKALLKIALSVLPNTYIPNYRIFNFLHKDEVLKQFAKVFFYELPHHHAVKLPVCYLFKKLNSSNKTTELIFALYFQNYIYQFPIHFHKSDFEIGLYNGGNYSIPMCPPIIFSKPKSTERYYRGIKDLSSSKTIIEEESISFSFDPNSIRDMKIFDPATGKPIEITSIDDIISMYIYSPLDKE
jgi:uncharacterized protein YbaR (Trm112 family)